MATAPEPTPRRNDLSNFLCRVCKVESPELPRILSCKHTLCLTCVERICTEIQDKECEKRQGSENVLRCPLCTVKTDIPNGHPEQLPFADYTQCKICDLCPISKLKSAANYCKECDTFLCTQCSKRHCKSKRFQTHKVGAVTLAICKDHGWKMEAHCSQCNKLLCKTCLNEGVCDDHYEAVKDLSDLKDVAAKEIADVIRILEEESAIAEREYLPLCSEIDSRIRQTNVLREQLRRYEAALMENVQNDSRRLMNELHAAENKLRKTARKLESNAPVTTDELMSVDFVPSNSVVNIGRIVRVPIGQAEAGAASSHPELRSTPTQTTRDDAEIDIQPDMVAACSSICELKVKETACLDHSCSPSLLWQKSVSQNGCGVTWTDTGHLVVSHLNAPTVSLWDACGNKITDSKEATSVLSADDQLDEYCDMMKNLQSKGCRITFHPKWHGGVIIVADPSNCRLVALNANNLQDVTTIGLQEHVDRLYGITVMRSGDLAVYGQIKASSSNEAAAAQETTARIVVLTTAGDVVHKWQLPQGHFPMSLCSTSDDHLLVSFMEMNQVHKYTMSGDLVWSTDGTTTPKPGALAVDPKGNIILTNQDERGFHMRVLSPEGDLLQQNLLPSQEHKCSGLSSLCLQDERLAVLHCSGSKLDLYSLASDL